ncbi:MAG: recombinase family protein, partial [Anaerovoracaceae bacterium]
MNTLPTGAYIRLSRKDGDKAESDSIVNQRKLLSLYLERHTNELSLYEFYIDDDYTGADFERPAFKKMMEDIRSSKVNCVLVKDLSRFGRDYIDVGNYLQKVFPKLGVRFVSVNDHIDSGKYAYDMLMPMKNVFNEQYARDISQKVLSAFNTKQENGQFIGAFASYGYAKDPNDRNKLVVDPYASETIKRIYEMFNSGMGKMSIARVLNNEKIPCPSEYKKSINAKYANCNKLNSTVYWTYSTIQNILNNEIYTGKMVQHKNNSSRYRNVQTRLVPKDEWIIIPNTHEAIISEEMWNTTQSLLKKRTREMGLTHNVSIYAGFLICGDCGRAMSKLTSSGVVRFVCGTYKRYSIELCSSHSIKQDNLNKIVLELINEKITKIKGFLQYIEKKEKEQTNKNSAHKTSAQITKLDIQLSKIGNLKKGLYEDYRNEILTIEEYKSFKNDYQNQENLISKQIESLRSLENNELTDLKENPWIRAYKDCQVITELTRPVLDAFIDKIIVYENKSITIKYKISDPFPVLPK